MEKNDKIIITVLIIVIIALVAGLAYMVMGNNLFNGEESAPKGMKTYDFNSEFKMAVPKDVKFLKEWNNSGGISFGQSYSYLDKNNEISVLYVDSPLITHELVDSMIDIVNSSGNATFEAEGDLIIMHKVKNDDDVSNLIDDTNFTHAILLQKGHRLVSVSGNDLDLIKSMIDSIEFYE